MEMKIKDPQQLFNFLLAAIALFFFTGVLPALNFDDKIRMTVERIKYCDDVDSVLQQLKSDKSLHINQINNDIVLEFKKPSYIFIYSNKIAETEFKKLLPKQFYVKIA